MGQPFRFLTKPTRVGMSPNLRVHGDAGGKNTFPKNQKMEPCFQKKYDGKKTHQSVKPAECEYTPPPPRWGRPWPRGRIRAMGLLRGDQIGSFRPWANFPFDLNTRKSGGEAIWHVWAGESPWGSRFPWEGIINIEKN